VQRRQDIHAKQAAHLIIRNDSAVAALPATAALPTVPMDASTPVLAVVPTDSGATSNLTNTAAASQTFREVAGVPVASLLREISKTETRERYPVRPGLRSGGGSTVLGRSCTRKGCLGSAPAATIRSSTCRCDVPAQSETSTSKGGSLMPKSPKSLTPLSRSPKTPLPPGS